MGSPAIYWGASGVVTLDGVTTWDDRRARIADVHRADSGLSETAVRERYDRLRFGVEAFSDLSTYDALVAWWSHAEQGKPFGVALDSADRVDTTLSASAVAGATSITVTSGTGIVAGRRYKIRDADGRNEEIVTVGGGYVSGTTVPLAAGLVYARASGAILRSVDWFPSMETEDDAFPVVNAFGLFYALDASCREYRP